jgi:hypothetical protein
MKKNSLFVKKIPKGEPDNFREDTEDFIHLIGNLNVEPFLQACAYDKINERYGPRLKKLVSLELSANLPDTDIWDWIAEVASTTTWWEFFIQLPEWKQIITCFERLKDTCEESLLNSPITIKNMEKNESCHFHLLVIGWSSRFAIK